MPVRMDQAQFGRQPRGLRAIMCTACNVVFDRTERAPKLLICGHFFCVMCLRSMTRAEYVICIICGRQTPSPSDIVWLPTYNPALPSRGTAEPTRHHAEMRTRLSVFPVSTNRARAGDHHRGSQQAGRSIIQDGSRGALRQSTSSVYGEQHPREIGMPLLPYADREILYGLTLPHGALNAIALTRRDPADDVNGSYTANGISHREYSSSMLSPSGDAGQLSMTLELNRRLSTNPNNDPEIVWITQTMNDLIQSLEITAGNYHNHERWVSTWYIQDEIDNLHLIIPDSHQIPFTFVNTIGELRDFLTELQRTRGPTSIFHFCLFLMYQKHKKFVEYILTDEAGLGDLNTVPNGTLNFIDLNGILTVDAQTQTDWWDIMEPSKSQASPSDGVEGEAAGGVVCHRPSLEVAIPEPLPFNFTRCDIANVYFMDFKIPGHSPGRVVVETFPAVAPLMSANFAVLCSGTTQVSYKGCKVFQCWSGQSIISGDTETNTGNGGKSILNDEFFEPDQTPIPPVRGTVGMRRLARNPASQKGKVSSQFRILLNTQPKITGIFGHVISGIEVVEAISQLDDGKGNPITKVFISNCGKLEF